MDKIKIVELDRNLIEKAEKLISKIFPSRSLPERLSLWVYRHREKWYAKLLMKLGGIHSLIKFYAAVNDNGDVYGTTGLYAYKTDAHEAIWLAWFCVDPSKRGQGIGTKLIKYSIDEARKHNKKYFRLYTSTAPGETVAQILYEKHGFKIKKQKRKLAYTIIYRELAL